MPQDKQVQFGRTYHLEVILPDTEKTIKRVTITKNRITLSANFSEKNLTTSSPSQILTLYNVDTEIIKYFRVEGAKVILKAGYIFDTRYNSAEDMPIVVDSDISASKVMYSGQDVILVLTLKDMVREKQTSVAKINMKKTETVENLVSRVANKLSSKVILEISETLGKKSLGKARSYSAIPSEILRSLALEFGLNTYFYNNALYISEANIKKLDSASDTVIVSIPVSEIKGGVGISADYTKAMQDGDDGLEVNFDILYNPLVKLGSVIKIDTTGYDDHQLNDLGNFKVTAMGVRLDTHSGDWDCSITAEPVSDSSYTQKSLTAEQYYDKVIGEVLYGNS